MTVGIVGLGLIGGSFAKAYHEQGHRVLAFDADQSVFEFATLFGAVDGALSDETLPDCDLILIAIYPGAAVEYLKDHGRSKCADIAGFLGLSVERTRAILSEMPEVESMGSNRHRTYRIR